MIGCRARYRGLNAVRSAGMSALCSIWRGVLGAPVSRQPWLQFLEGPTVTVAGATRLQLVGIHQSFAELIQGLAVLLVAAPGLFAPLLARLRGKQP